jgi:predicted Fe-S protein YdhL (DUF1289 family)
MDICITRDGMCIGCLRTLEEMANWKTYTDQEKLAVLEKIKIRRGNQDYYGGPGN